MDHWYKNEIVISGIITVGIQPINLIQPSSCSPSGQTGGERLLWLTSHFLVSQLSKVAHEATEKGANPLGPENSRVTMCQSEGEYQFVDLKVQTGIRES